MKVRPLLQGLAVVLQILKDSGHCVQNWTCVHTGTTRALHHEHHERVEAVR
jgi:hypothetical protein